MIPDNTTILFQGDSITDCMRVRDLAHVPNDLAALGMGYAKMAAAELLSKRPSVGLRIFNRGIAGNRIVDLDARVKSDIIQLKPDWLSILIGVNDTWREKDSGDGVDVAKYERIYRDMLAEIRAALPAVNFVLCEPFVLRCGVVDNGWIEEIDLRRAVVAKLALEFDAAFVPFQSLFSDALNEAGPEFWAGDGVHPSTAGHLRMAKCWLDRVFPCHV